MHVKTHVATTLNNSNVISIQQIVLDIDELSRTDIDEPIVLIKDYRDISGEDVIQVLPPFTKGVVHK